MPLKSATGLLTVDYQGVQMHLHCSVEGNSIIIGSVSLTMFGNEAPQQQMIFDRLEEQPDGSFEGTIFGRPAALRKN